MEFNQLEKVAAQLHFAHPLWLWGALVIPLIGALFFLSHRRSRPFHQLERFIDRHLLPYLLVNPQEKRGSFWKKLLLWSCVWSCLTLALAGPRWSFREVETFSQDQSLVILLDLSESMNATDVKPSRLVRAKQKIEDLLNLSKGVKIGLIAFAADAHMIAPVTEDKETIRHLLSSLETDLIYVQGSRLTPAFEMARGMLKAEQGNNKALLVISDGGFEDASAILVAKQLGDAGIVIHSMGMGTSNGAPLQERGSLTPKNRAPIVSKLEKERLSEISIAGKGRYLDAHYLDHEEATILKELETQANAQLNIGKKQQFWDEHFYLMILPTLPILLWWFRRESVLALVLIFFTGAFHLEATVLSSKEDYFKNSEELGKEAFDEGDYEAAANAFQDPYRRGVAYYRANNFVEAEQMFRQSSRLDVASSSAYNLGNSLVQQPKFKEAISAYEDVLRRWPDHIKAKENLDLVKNMLEKEQQNPSRSEDQNKEGSKKDSENEEKSESQSSKDQSEKEPPQQNQQQQGKDSAEGEEKQDLQKEGDDDSNRQQGEQENKKETDEAPKESRQLKAPKSQEDQDADLWLNQITNEPKAFLKNKFYLESKRNGTKKGMDPW